MTGAETLTAAEKLELCRFLAEEACELTKDCDTWVKEFWLLRNALKDIARLIGDGRSDDSDACGSEAGEESEEEEESQLDAERRAEAEEEGGNFDTEAPDVLNPLLQAIIDAPLPGVRNPLLRHEVRKERAKQVRKLFKDMGLKGIGVTTPNYALARSIDVTLPRNDPAPTVTGDDGFPTLHPAYTAQRNAAFDKARRIILAAFPDLDDRSDSMVDYFDDPIHVR